MWGVHDLTAKHRVDQFGRNEYWMVCECGWESRPRIFPFEATRDGFDHAKESR